MLHSIKNENACAIASELLLAGCRLVCRASKIFQRAGLYFCNSLCLVPIMSLSVVQDKELQ